MTTTAEFVRNPAFVCFKFKKQVNAVLNDTFVEELLDVLDQCENLPDSCCGVETNLREAMEEQPQYEKREGSFIKRFRGQVMVTMDEPVARDLFDTIKEVHNLPKACYAFCAELHKALQGYFCIQVAELRNATSQNQISA